MKGHDARQRLEGLTAFSTQVLDSGVAVVSMRREEKLSAMDRRYFVELLDLCEALDEDPEIRSCVLTGAGRAFSAGGDIETFAQLRAAGDLGVYRSHLRLVYAAFHAVEIATTPFIAAVNGLAFGGGTELTLACDLAICSDRARFSFKEVTVGLMPGYGVIRGPEVIGRTWTKRLALTGDEIGPEEALRIGLVQEVVPHATLLSSAIELAERIASRSSTAVAVAKQFLNRGTGVGFAESLEATALLFGTAEHAEAVEAFFSRKDPK